MVFSFYHMYIGKAYYMVPVCGAGEGPMVYRFMGLVLSCRGVRVYTNSVPDMASHLLPIEAERMSKSVHKKRTWHGFTPPTNRSRKNVQQSVHKSVPGMASHLLPIEAERMSKSVHKKRTWHGFTPPTNRSSDGPAERISKTEYIQC